MCCVCVCVCVIVHICTYVVMCHMCLYLLTYIGTMQYMAPEVIRSGQRGYGPPVSNYAYYTTACQLGFYALLLHVTQLSVDLL